MLYVVGGCSRSGKSLLAERMRVRHDTPWFPLDALKMGLHLGAPTLSVHPDDDELETADRIWPIVEGLLDHFVFDGRDYLVEGVNLRPSTVAGFIARSDMPVRACFLGYPDADISAKALQIERHAGVPQDWLHRTGPQNVRRHLAHSRAFSDRLRAACAGLSLPFVDTGADVQAGVARAERLLIEGDTFKSAAQTEPHL